MLSDTVARCIYTNIMRPHMTPNWERLFWVKGYKPLMTETSPKAEYVAHPHTADRPKKLYYIKMLKMLRDLLEMHEFGTA